MSAFKAKMHQNLKLGWGSAPDPAGGAYSAPRPLAGSLLLRGGERRRGEWRGWERRGREGRGREGRGRKGREREGTGGECCGVQKILKIDHVA